LTRPSCPSDETRWRRHMPAQSKSKYPGKIRTVALFRSFPFQTAENPLLPVTG
jgi:hypothetical protein